MTADPRLTRIAEIDASFAAATRWGSWMNMLSKEREQLVSDLRAEGHDIAHKDQFRTVGGRVD